MSTDVQLKGDSLRRQLEQSRDYAAKQGWDLLEEDQLRDIGVSAYQGANVAEGALGRFLQAIRDRRVETGSYLIIESLDRLSRQVVLKSLGIFTEILNAGVGIVTLTDGKLYTGGARFEDIIVSIVSMGRAHEESLVKSHRLSAAWSNKRRNASTRKMTSWCPAWLRLSDDRKEFQVIEERAEVVRSIFQDSADGIGTHTITRRLNARRVPTFGRHEAWHEPYVNRVLRNRSVMGEFQPHRIVDGKRVPDGDPIQDYFPAVIEPELFHRVTAARADRRTRATGRKGRSVSNLFSGLLRCSYCGGRMAFAHGSGTYLVCYSYKRGLGCSRTRWKYDDFETSFLTFCSEVDLEAVIRTGEDARKLSNLQDTVAALRGEQTSLKEQMDRTFELLNMGTATKYVGEKLAALEARRDAIDAELREREQELARTGTVRDLGIEELRSMIGRVQGGSGDEVFKLRSALQARLRSIVNVVHVAPNGHAPLVRRTIDFLRAQAGADDVIAHLEKQAESDEEKKRYFSVGFRGNSVRIVFPEDGDPTKFHVQVTSSRDEGLMRRYPDHDEQVFPPRLDASDLEEG
jgi:DNA invertase Pin-like site-specific DNA recombinase